MSKETAGKERRVRDGSVVAFSFPIIARRRRLRARRYRVEKVVPRQLRRRRRSRCRRFLFV